MRQIIRMVVVLTGVCVGSGFLLSFSYKKLSCRIEQNQKRKVQERIFSLIDNAASFTLRDIGGRTLYTVRDKSHHILGYCIIEEGNGYQGKIKILVGIKPDLKTLWGIDIIEHQETPGLGARIGEAHFKRQFKDLISVPQIDLVKRSPASHNEVQAISGATISSRAVVKIVNKAIGFFKKNLGNGKD